MKDTKDLCPIGDYLPIKAISGEATREKSVLEGDTSGFHL